MDPQPDNLRQRTVRGTSWRLASVLVQFSSQFIVGVVLARLLSPEDFGLLGLAMIAIGFCELFVDLGIGPAIIQRENLTTRHIRVGFSVSVAVGCILTILIYFLAPLVAIVFKDERITDILRVLSLTFLVMGFGIVSVSLLTRWLAFKQLLVVDVLSYILGYALIAVFLALQGYGIWSLVYGTFVQMLLNALLAFLLVRHSIKPLVSAVELRELIGFGAGVSLAKVVNYFAKQGDYFVVGRVLGPGPLGLYLRAYQLMQLPLRVLVVQVAAKILFPVVSQIQSDREKVSRVYVESLSLVTFLTLPCIAIMLILAPEFINGVYGPQWREASYLLQILLLFAIFQVVYFVAYQFAQAMGHVYRLFLCQVVYGLAVFLGSWFAALHWGTVGVTIAVGLSIILVFALVVNISNRLTNTPSVRFFRSQVPAVVITIPTALSCYLVRGLLVDFGFSDILVLLLASFASLLAAGLSWLYLPSTALDSVYVIVMQLLEDKDPSKLMRFLPLLSRRHKQPVVSSRG